MTCEKCGAELQVGDYPFCRGRQDDHVPGSAVVVGDECDFVQTNGLKHPRRFQSKLEFKRWLKENDFQVKDTHVAPLDSDKSPHTSNWGSRMDPYTANNVRILMERAFATPSREDEPLNMNIRTFVRDHA